MDALYRVRRLIAEAGDDAWLVANDEALALSGVWVDAHEFLNLSRSDDLSELERAADLYQGDVCPDLYDEWVAAPRAEYRDCYLTLLETLTTTYQSKNDLATALRYGRRLVMAEPFHEYNQQIYLRLLGRLGRRTEALAHYEYLRGLLQKELAIEPLPETQAVIAAIQREAAEHKPGPVEVERLPFVGRTIERGRAIELFEKTLSGRGGLLTIEGEAGLGKSRLLRELAHSAEWRGFTVIIGRASQTPFASPLTLLTEALTPLIKSRQAQLEALLPKETIAALAPLLTVWPDQVPLPALPPEHQLYRYQRAVATLFATLTRLTPLLLILDDVHWADPSIWQTLAAFVPQLDQSRLCLVLAYRRPEIEAGAGWSTLQAWDRAGHLNVIKLKPLAEADVAQALPDDQKPAAGHLWAVTGGNPFLLIDALESVAEGQPPESTLQDRIAQLPSDTQAALECAAVLGTTVSFLLWAKVVGRLPYALAEAGDLLIRHHFLQPIEIGYAFTHDLIQANVYARLESDQRRALHSRAAEALAESDSDNYRLRAFHCDRAGHAVEAVTLYQQAAEQDVARSAYAEARAAYDRALQLIDPEPSRQRAEVLMALTRASFIAQESSVQPDFIGEILQITHQVSDATLQARAYLLAGESAMKTGQEAEALKLFEQALAFAEAANDLTLQGEALNLLGETAWRLGTLPAARQYYERQLAVAHQTRDRAQEGAALEGIAFVTASVGDQPDVLKYMRESLAIRRELGDRFREAQATNSLISALQAAGQLDEVLVEGPKALALNDSIGYTRGASIIRAGLAMVHGAIGNYEQARELITTARDYFATVKDETAVALYNGTLGIILDRGGDPVAGERWLQQSIEGLLTHNAEFFAALTQMDLGTLYVRQTRYAEAAPVLQTAADVFRANDSTLELQRSLAMLGLAYFQLGNHDQAQTLADETWQVFADKAPAGDDRHYYLWAFWQLNLALDRPDRALIALTEAQATLQHQTQMLNDSALRTQFLNRVQINREIAEAFAQANAPTGRRTVRLARADAPLGIALTDDHKVDVVWTVDAGDSDVAVFEQEGKAGLRRHRLRRLLAEAQAQNAAPTDSDLAEALNVARRTIERDMADLRQQGDTGHTRRRK